jgi:hypothetical protein
VNLGWVWTDDLRPFAAELAGSPTAVQQKRLDGDRARIELDGGRRPSGGARVWAT